MNHNKLNGNHFEKELCQILYKHGFWAHNLAQNAQGQPFDVIAARKGTTWVIDCKVCENDVFRFSRVEENQESAMALWEMTGNTAGWFALKLSDGSIWFITLSLIQRRRTKQAALNRDEITSLGLPLRKWLG